MKQFSQGQIFVALDLSEEDLALTMARKIAPYCAGLKIGMEFFMKFGPQGVVKVSQEAGKPLFLDLKFHDIPNTVAGAVHSVAALRPALLTLHAAGGFLMLKAAKEAAEEAADRIGCKPPTLLAVSIMTSLEPSDLCEIGYQRQAAAQVQLMAELAVRAGIDGLVCSGKELNPLRAQFGEDLTLVVPGIRPAGGEAQDQKRIMTPQEAKRQGADILVIGRPITQAPDPAIAAQAIAQSLSGRAQL